MQVRNTSAKTIGLGGMFIVPGGTGVLPDGYGADHPAVKSLFGMGWLAPLDGKQEHEEGAASEEAEKQKAARIDNVAKELSKRNLEPLREEAAKLGVGYADGDTKAELIAKIIDKLKAE